MYDKKYNKIDNKLRVTAEEKATESYKEQRKKRGRTNLTKKKKKKKKKKK